MAVPFSYVYQNLAMSARTAVPQAEAIPGIEEDCPCCFTLVCHSQSIQKAFVRCKHGGGVNLRIAYVILSLRSVVFASYISYVHCVCLHCCF